MCRHRGFTLAEVLIASGVLAFAVAAITQAIVAGQMQTYEALHNWRGLCLVEAMLDEVLRLPYNDPQGGASPGPDAGETNRSAYDNSDDYQGYSEAAGSVADVAGAAYADKFSVFSRSVTAAYTQQTVPGMGNPIDGLQVAVTVTDDRGMTWSITRFIPEPVN